MGEGPFRHFDCVALRVQDLARSREWYEQKLGFTAEFAEGPIVIFGTGGPTRLTIYELQEGEEAVPKGAGSFPIFYPEDLDAAYALLQERGVEVGPIGSSGNTRWFSFFDLDGNRLDVCWYAMSE
jgi:catechol 2,3-dioxygenase-like lactoylglutathione lyase family enzyme